MSTELVAKEIQRFLASDDAEVLCIRGRWGVGKTYAWLRYLTDAQRNGLLKAERYAYVSLFGLNSPDDLRHAIFESTVEPSRIVAGPTIESLSDLIGTASAFGRKSRGLIGPLMSAFGQGDVGNAIAKSAFLLVRKQLICFDDLERSGEDLKARDVLGLVSFLKEQRKCKVVLLLNDEALDDDEQEEFQRLLEKVVDVSLTFAPTPEEAAGIALQDDEPVGARLRVATITLGITNIRVIKKIERLALRLATLLKNNRPEVLDQGIIACALGGWSVFQPDHAPRLDLVRNYNSIVWAMRDRRGEQPDEMAKWRDRLSLLPYTATDQFDQVILDGVVAGFFDEQKLAAEAQRLDQELARTGRDSPFKQAWERYHGSLVDEDEEVVEGIRQAALGSLVNLDPNNINAVIRLLREFGQPDQADELINTYVAAKTENRQYFNFNNHHFTNESPADPALRAAFQRRYDEFVDTRDPVEVLKQIAEGNGWGDDDEHLVANLSAGQFEAIFEQTQGPTLRRVIQAALRLASNGSPSAARMNAPLRQALKNIAAKSPLRARRLRSWGFNPDDHEDE